MDLHGHRGQQSSIKERVGLHQPHDLPHIEVERTRSWPTEALSAARLPVLRIPATARSQVRRPHAAQFAVLGCRFVDRMHRQPPIRPISLGLTSRGAQSWQGRLDPGRLGACLSPSCHACPQSFPWNYGPSRHNPGSVPLDIEGARAGCLGFRGSFAVRSL